VGGGSGARRVDRLEHPPQDANLAPIDGHPDGATLTCICGASGLPFEVPSQ
jgi:hypothetical protein